MITKSQAKRKQDIKTKLMAAIAMLLVSSIMMVSSTYAWFTLSTAPEVTGINTAVGANGNLEMALLPYGNDADSITTTVSDGNKELVERNKTWGNLVDLAPEGAVDYYGLNDITLYPSALNVATWDDDTNMYNPTAINTASFLQVPTYGADGRIDELVGTQTGVFDKTEEKYYPVGASTEHNGVRAIGSASGLTPRQLDYRNAIANGNTATSQAKTFAARSLNDNGDALANIAITAALDEAGTAKYGQTDMAALRKMIDSLKGVDAAEGVTAKDGVIDYLERAYIQYIFAMAASNASTDAGYSAVAGAVNTDGATLESVLAVFPDGVELPAGINNAIDQFDAIVDAVDEADAALSAIESKAEVSWAELKPAMDPLVATAGMTINNLTMAQIKAEGGMSQLVNSVLGTGGINLILGSGAGVYADIADQCGYIEAKITIKSINYPVGSDSKVENVPATMKTNGRNPSYLSAIGVAVSGNAPSAGANDSMPISDVYGYIIDLAFRTNASSSNLLLQQEGVDRIYDGNSNEETMGNGSSMTFQASTADFNDTQVKGLMDAIRIVFFNPANNNEVVATAKLDTAAAQLTGDGWKAYLYLYENGASGEVRSSDNAIMALNQNEAHALSVLVYLDGNEVENKDVAATGSTSMTGSLNLQFASSAELVPMEYADLHITGNQADDDDTEATQYDVTVDTVAANKATAGQDYTYTLEDGKTIDSITVGGVALGTTDYTIAEKVVTIPAAKVTGAIVITTKTA